VQLFRRIIIALTVLAFMCIFPQTVQAMPTRVDVYYCTFDYEGTAVFTTEAFDVYGDFGVETLAFIRFANFFENLDHGKIPCVPNGVKLHGVWLAGDELIISVSRALFDYGGGSGHERLLISQIVRNAAETKEARFVTVLVDGVAVTSPEGMRLLRRAIDDNL